MQWSTGVLSAIVLAALVLVPNAGALPAGPSAAPAPTEDSLLAQMSEWAKTQDTAAGWIDGSVFLATQSRTGVIPWIEDQSGSSRASSRAYVLTNSGVHINLYVDSASNPYPNASQRQDLVTEWDTVIYPNDVAGFGNTANVVALCILTVDGASGIGGYFPGGCNGGDSVAIDAADLPNWGYEIAAHELQHYIHCDQDCNENLWVNEGMSDVAILFSYPINQTVGVAGHVWDFENNPHRALKVFNNAGHDYGSTFAYFWYINEHYGGTGTIRAITTNTANDEAGINAALSARGYAATFNSIFYDWAIANILDDETNFGGKYGYNQIDLRARATSQIIFPVAASDNVETWGVKYISFNSGGMNELRITATLSSGLAKRYIIAVGLSGNPTTITEMTANDMTVTDFGLGGKYNPVYLVVASSAQASFDYTATLVDRIPPITTPILDPATPDGTDGWYTKKPTVTFTTDEPATIRYHWDAAADSDYSTKLTALEGEHTLSYHSVDTAGNVETERSMVIKVDSVAPVTTLTTAPAAPAATGWFQVPVTVTLAADKPSGITYHWDSEVDQPYAAPFPALEGAHTLHYRAISAQGHAEATKSAPVNVDTIAPVITPEIIPAAPDGKDGWYRTQPSVTLVSDDPGTSIQWTLDQGSLAPYTGTFTIDDGEHALRYTATDPAGNTLAEVTLPFKVDSRPPATEGLLEPAEPDGAAGWFVNLPSITLSTADPLAVILYAWDVEDLSAVEGTVYGGELALLQGDHELTFWAEDQAGNREEAQTMDLKLDTVAPVTTLAVDPDADLTGWLVHKEQVVLTSEFGAATMYAWDRDASVVSRGRFNPPEGQHRLSFWSVDQAGNAEEQRSQSFKVDLRPPVAKLVVTPAAPTEGQSTGFDGSGSSDPNGIALMQVDFGDGEKSPSMTTVTQAVHKYKKAGTYTAVLTVEDTAGQVSTSEVVVRVTPAPVIGCVFGCDDGGTGSMPWYQRSIGGVLPTWLGLLLMLVLVVGAVGAVVSRRRAHARAKGLEDYEPGARENDSPFPQAAAPVYDNRQSTGASWDRQDAWRSAGSAGGGQARWQPPQAAPYAPEAAEFEELGPGLPSAGGTAAATQSYAGAPSMTRAYAGEPLATRAYGPVASPTPAPERAPRSIPQDVAAAVRRPPAQTVTAAPVAAPPAAARPVTPPAPPAVPPKQDPLDDQLNNILSNLEHMTR